MRCSLRCIHSSGFPCRPPPAPPRVQVAVHAIGDRAVDEVAACYIEALAAAGQALHEDPLALAQRLRPHIEHVQVGQGDTTGVGGCRGRHTASHTAACWAHLRLHLQGLMAPTWGEGPHTCAPAAALRVRPCNHPLPPPAVSCAALQHVSGRNVSEAMARHGLVAVPNPLHLLTDRTMLLPRLGAQRAAPHRSFAYATMLASGLRPGLASDW